MRYEGNSLPFSKWFLFAGLVVIVVVMLYPLRESFRLSGSSFGRLRHGSGAWPWTMDLTPPSSNQVAPDRWNKVGHAVASDGLKFTIEQREQYPDMYRVHGMWPFSGLYNGQKISIPAVYSPVVVAMDK